MLPNFIVLCMQVWCWDDSPIVNTNLGKVKGEFRTSYQQRIYSSFEGIPYAQPPIGDLRFKEPVPASKWEGTLDAKSRYECIQQTETNVIVGTEDCLYLNVYVPGKKIDAKNNFDVIVHIHSGGFSSHSAFSYTNPDFLMDIDIILVTLNYRIGILGFLSTEDYVIPGNNGLKDQVLALKWIEKNIKHFGGNPYSITLTGLEAGGASVHLHYFSPLSKDLFHRGFSQSGTALNPWSLQKDAHVKARKLATALNCNSGDNANMVKCLRKREANMITSKFLLFKSQGFPVAPFGPVVEKHVTNSTFLHDHPFNLLLKGEVHDVPWIASNVADEGAHFVKNIDMNRVKMLWKMSAPTILDFKNTLVKTKWNHVSKEIINFYLERKEANLLTNVTLSQIIGDRLFTVDTERAVKAHSNINKSKVYYYRFQYENNNQGVFQGSDTFYIFPNITKNKPSKNDLLMTEQLRNMLMSYASNSEPKFNDVEWLPVNGNEVRYLKIMSPINMKMETEHELIPTEFWNSLGFKENQNLFIIK